MTSSRESAPRHSNQWPARWYIWPEEPGMFSSPLANYEYEPSEEDARIYIPVRQLSTEEIAAREIARRIEEKRKTLVLAGPQERTALYRLRDAGGSLLYVGISAAPSQRWVQHAGDKKWWPDVAQFFIEWFESRPEALLAEELAIRLEAPRHNVRHNQTAA